MKDLSSSYLCAFQQRTYFPTKQIYGSPVLNPLSSLVKLISICNKGHCVMRWWKRPTDDAWNDFLCNFPTQISRSIKWSILIGNCHKSNYQDFSSTLCSIMDWFMTILSIREFLVRNSLLYARLSLQLFIDKKAKIFWSYVKHFWILAGVRKCIILTGLCK